MITSSDFKKVPKLRFPGFSGVWDEKKLGDLGKFIGGGTPSKNVNKYWSGNIPWVSSSDIPEDNIKSISYTRYITQEAVDNSATKIVPKGSILLVSRVGVGKLAINDLDVCTSQDFTNLKPESIEVLFLAYLLKNKKSKLLGFNQGTSIKGFTKDDIASLLVYTPHKSEQTKIAGFLGVVDDRISALQKKVELLQKYKKGIMKKIFPLAGGQAPQIRFPGFSEPWQEKTLSSVGEIVTGKTPSTSNADLWDGDTMFVTPTDMIEGQKYQKTTARSVNNTKNVLPAKSIMYTCIASIGKMSLSIRPAITNQQINSLIPSNDFDNEYIYYVLLWSTPRIKATSSDAAFSIINKTEFSKITISVPNKPEQQKIADFLTSIDDKIDLTERELEQAKKFKSSLLQQMFV